MSTRITNKKQLLNWLKKEIKDDQIILISDDLIGEVSVKPKINTKKISFGFAADAFKRKDSVGDIALGKTPVFAISICDKKDASDNTVKLFNEIK